MGRAIPAPEFPKGMAKVSVAAALLVGFCLCQSSLPQVLIGVSLNNLLQ
jgi:uncharacterized membrane protein